MTELRATVRQLTRDLNVLVEQLSRTTTETQQAAEALPPEIMRDFQASLDAIRHILWSRSQAAHHGDAREFQYAMRSLRLQRAIDLLRTLREEGTPGSSLVEQVNAVVDSYANKRS